MVCTYDYILRRLFVLGKPVKKPTTKPGNDVCKVQKFDAIFYHSRTRNTYFLKGKYVWEINEKRMITRRDLISSRWPGLESEIDSAYVRRSDGDIIFFKGSRYNNVLQYIQQKTDNYDMMASIYVC